MLPFIAKQFNLDRTTKVMWAFNLCKSNSVALNGQKA